MQCDTLVTTGSTGCCGDDLLFCSVRERSAVILLLFCCGEMQGDPLGESFAASATRASLPFRSGDPLMSGDEANLTLLIRGEFLSPLLLENLIVEIALFLSIFVSFFFKSKICRFEKESFSCFCRGHSSGVLLRRSARKGFAVVTSRSVSLIRFLMLTNEFWLVVELSESSLWCEAISSSLCSVVSLFGLTCCPYNRLIRLTSTGYFRLDPSIYNGRLFLTNFFGEFFLTFRRALATILRSSLSSSCFVLAVLWLTT